MTGERFALLFLFFEISFIHFKSIFCASKNVKIQEVEGEKIF